MVKHDLRVGTTIEIGDAKIRLEHKSGQRVSLIIDAPADVPIKLPKKFGNTQDIKAKNAITSA